jgi:hypothetical protein
METDFIVFISHFHKKQSMTALEMNFLYQLQKKIRSLLSFIPESPGRAYLYPFLAVTSFVILLPGMSNPEFYH